MQKAGAGIPQSPWCFYIPPLPSLERMPPLFLVFMGTCIHQGAAVYLSVLC